MADILAKQYNNVFSKPSDDHIDPNVEFADNVQMQLTDVIFDVEDITEAIKDASSTSASGPDGLPIILLQKCLSLAKPLHMFWNKCWNAGITVQSLKEPVVIPIHKGGNRGIPANYRPISLTSHIIKLFEKIVRKAIVTYIEDNKLFNSTQHGFRMGRSCLSQLLAHYDKILSFLENGMNVDVVYLDFSKAFDKVDYDILLKKLSDLGIGGKIGRWIHSFLTGRRQCVLVNGIRSEYSPVLSGVPQGSVLGPLLFLILIGDIDDSLLESILSSFADDTRLMNAIKNVLDASKFQTDLNTVYEWAPKNKMEFNDVKFELIRYWLSNDPLKELLSYTTNTGTLINEKETIKDLGVMLSNSGKFDCHIDKVIDTVKRLTSWVLRSFESRCPQVMITLWKTIVLPHLEYCSQLWCPIQKGQIQRLEALQWSYLRKIKGNNNSNYWESLSKFRLYSLQRRRERYRIIYLWKILEGLVPNLVGSHGEIVSSIHHRLGRKCNIRNDKSDTSSTNICNLRKASFSMHSTQLFNSLPRDIRNLSMCSVPHFKCSLDAFMSSIPDEPLIIGYTHLRRAPSNSILDMVEWMRQNLKAGGSNASTWTS